MKKKDDEKKTKFDPRIVQNAILTIAIYSPIKIVSILYVSLRFAYDLKLYFDIQMVHSFFTITLKCQCKILIFHIRFEY